MPADKDAGSGLKTVGLPHALDARTPARRDTVVSQGHVNRPPYIKILTIRAPNLGPQKFGNPHRSRSCWHVFGALGA